MIDWKKINAVLISLALSANVVKGQTEGQTEKLPTDELQSWEHAPTEYVAPQGLVYGAAFIDRILPMSVGKDDLRSDVWGGSNVRPRNVNNGIEDPEWSYWCRSVHQESDGLYHLFGARWPESKGFDAWPTSRVYHAVSSCPTGPFKVIDPDIGRGHNVTCFRSRYGDYIISGLFEDYIGKSVNGPWKSWKILLDFRGGSCPDTSNNTYVSREDGSVLMINQPGRVWISEDGLKPFRKVTDAHGVHPCTLGIFEDPIIWRDEVQYHAIYNDWYGRTAYYMRSKDGVNWVWDPGIAYNYQVAKHPDGTSERWYKYERPSVLLDKYGRASHIYFAVIDSRKDLDKPNDNHNTKNIALPLILSRRLELMEKDAFLKLKDFTVRIKGEPGFLPEKDVDVSSLRFGAPSAVDFGKGLIAKSAKKEGDDLVVVFSGTSAGFTESDFVGKMLGKDNAGKPVFGYVRLPGVSYNDPIIDAGRPKIQNGELLLTVENFGMADSKKGTVFLKLERNGKLKKIEVELPVIPAYQHTDIKVPLDKTWLTGEGCTVLDLTIHGGGVPWKYKEVFQTEVALHEGNEMDLTLPAAFKSGDKLLLATGQTFEKGMALCSPSSYTWLVDGEFDELRLSVGAAKSSLGGSVFEVWGDGKLLTSTPLLRPKSIYPELHKISVPVKGIRSLSFVVNRFFVHDSADKTDAHVIIGDPLLIKNK